MSLAPASSRGAFLKARLAVNGIQCAARSLGTLTAAGRGLLSSMGASSSFGAWRLAAQAISFVAGRERHGPHYFRPIGRFSGSAAAACSRQTHRSAAPIQNTSPSDSSVSSQSSGNCGNAASSASRPRPISHNSPPWGVRCRPASLQNAADEIEPVGAAVEGEFGLGAAFARQLRHAFARRHRAGWK